jgi:hypothetical protein
VPFDSQSLPDRRGITSLLCHARAFTGPVSRFIYYSSRLNLLRSWAPYNWSGLKISMAIAIIQFFIVGLLIVLPVSASNRKAAQCLHTDPSSRTLAHCKGASLPIVTISWPQSSAVSLYQRNHAIFVATRVFRSIGVNLDWRTGAVAAERKSCGCDPPEIIEVQVDPSASRNLTTGALAYALPTRTSGVRIRVIDDRVAEFSTNVPNLLGYVLAHEIGHVLQGVARHSEEGILKAKWNGTDYNLMRALRLTFNPDDAEMIRNHFSQQHPATD